MNVLVVNGPNLNTLGEREPEIYGSESLAELEERLLIQGASLGAKLTFFQSNHEGKIIDLLQSAKKQHGIILNPGGLAYSSVSLRDCVAALSVPVVEVHITNIFAREDFRRNSLLAPVCRGLITGLGGDGYLLALRWLILRQEERIGPVELVR